MAKTIKFNLICDNNPIRTIEDLQGNFSIEDVLKYYQNGLLLRWLKVRGYEEEYKKVSEIKEKDTLEIIKKLISIFEVEADEKKVEEGVYILKFQEERKELCKLYKQDNFKVQNIINDYQRGFEQLIDDIVENPDDIARIKANIAELMLTYKWAMDLNHVQLYWELKGDSPLAIMCFLMNEEARKYYLPMPIGESKDSNIDEEKNNDLIEEKKSGVISFLSGMQMINEGRNNDSIEEKKSDSTAIIYDIAYDEDKRKIYHDICRMIKSQEFDAILEDDLRTYSGETDGYWKDIEAKGKKYMIISMDVGDYVRSAGVQGGDLARTDILDKFVIVDGIDYKSNSAHHKLRYMEV